MFRSQAILKTKADKIDDIISYINSVKPFHTKIVDTVVTFQIEEQVNINVVEDVTSTLDLWFDERVYDTHGFEKQGFGKSGIDQFPNQVSPSPLRFEADAIYDRLRACIEPDSNVYFCGYDDIPFGDAGLDIRISDGRDLHEGFDDVNAGYDINTFDFVFIDKVALERFKNCDISKLRDYHLGSRYLIDHIEEPSPTTIKATITETVIIDTSSQIPQGFDYMQYSTDNFDSIPREHIAFNIVNVGTGPIGGSPTSVTLVPTQPAPIVLPVNTVNDSEK